MPIPEEQEKVADLAARTLDISQFLVDKVGVTAAVPGAEDGKIAVTYHDPCHLKKSLGVAAQPRALLQANPDYVLKEMPESDWCCGCGGSFNLQHYETSAAIGKRKQGQHRQIPLPGGGHGLPRLHAANHRHAVPGRDAGNGETCGGDLCRHVSILDYAADYDIVH